MNDKHSYKLTMALFLIGSILFAGVVFWITLDKASAAYIDDVAAMTELSGKERMKNNVSMFSPYNAKKLLAIIKDPWARGMQVTTNMDKGSDYKWGYETMVFSAVIDLEKAIGKTKQSTMSAEDKKDVLMKARAYMGATVFIIEEIEVPVYEIVCTENNILDYLKDFSLQEAINLFAKN